MKSKLYFVLVVLFSTLAVSCSKDEEARKGDADLTHEGVKWNIASIEYTLIDQNTSGGMGQTFKSGTKENAGSFYFVDGGEKGSFEFNVEGYNKEDAFNYTIDNEEVSIIDIEQTAGVKTNQNVIVLTGSASEAEMTLSGTLVKQSTSGQFMMEMELVLKK
jgi:uncharacterized protein YprB with RNaseH-like and TPR domain